MPEQHTWRARHQGTTEHSHVGHCTHTSGSGDVEALKPLSWQIVLHVPYLETTQQIQHYTL